MFHQNNKTLRIVVDSNKQHLENKDTTNFDFVKYALQNYRYPCGEEYTTFHDLVVNYSVKINDVKSLKLLYDSNIFDIRYHRFIVSHIVKSADISTLKYFNKSNKKLLSCLNMSGKSECLQCINKNTTPEQQLECLKYLISIGGKVYGKITANIIKYSNIEVIKFLLDNGCHADQRNIIYDVCSLGNLEMLLFFIEKKYKLTNNCPIAVASNDPKELDSHDHLQILKYLHENNCPGMDKVYDAATRYNNLPVVKFMVENNYKFTNSQPLINAAHNQELEIMKYLHDNKCPWSEAVCQMAAQQGSLECLKYAHENGCPWNATTVNASASNCEDIYNNYIIDKEHDFFSCLKYAVENGCPFDNETFEYAIGENIDSLKYLVEKGCPIDSDKIEQFVHEKGEMLRLSGDIYDFVDKIVKEKRAKESKKHTILIVGDAGVGKTTFINRHMTGHFTKEYTPSTGYGYHKLPFESETFIVVDSSGQEKYSNHGLVKDVEGIVIMFDVTSKLSYYNVPQWYTTMRKQYGDEIPIILCGNKVDLPDRKVSTQMITFHWEYNMKYYDISAKSNYNYEKPFFVFNKMFENELTFEGELKDYQTKIVDEVFEKIDNGPGIITMPCGAGK